MREPFRLICAVIIGSAMALFGLAGVAIATPANTLDSNVAESDPYLTFRGIVKVKCPVVNLRILWGLLSDDFCASLGVGDMTTLFVRYQ